jgi:exosortase
VEPEATQEDSPPRVASGGPGAASGPPALADLPPPGWRALALLLLNALFAYVAFGPLGTFDSGPDLEKELEGVFFRPSDTSPTVVVLLAAWLVYRRWDRLRRLPLTPGPPWLSGGLLLLAGAILAWASFVRVDDLRVPALMALLMAFGALFGGPRGMRALLLPTLFLLFAIPMPAPLLNVILIEMQYATAEFAGLLLHLLGHTAFVTGEQIIREGNNFAIIETCSGVRITETLTMLTILMLDLFRRRPLHSAILLLLTPAVAFLFNGLRAVTIILNPHSDVTEIHTLQGIAMLLGGLLVLYAIDGLLGWLLPLAPPPAGPPPTTAGPRPLYPTRPRFATAALAVLAAIAALMPQWSPPRPDRAADILDGFEEVAGWRSSELRPNHKFMGRMGMWRDVYRRYRRRGDVVDFYAAVGMRGARPRSILFSKALLPGSGWNTQEEGTLRLASRHTLATWRVAVSGTRRYLVISWHEEAEDLAVESLRFLLGLDRSPLRRPGEALAVRLATRMLGPGPTRRAEAEFLLLQFHDAVRPTLDALSSDLRGDTG